jgi:hypothetical protein
MRVVSSTLIVVWFWMRKVGCLQSLVVEELLVGPRREGITQMLKL